MLCKGHDGVSVGNSCLTPPWSSVKNPPSFFMFRVCMLSLFYKGLLPFNFPIQSNVKCLWCVWVCEPPVMVWHTVQGLPRVTKCSMSKRTFWVRIGLVDYHFTEKDLDSGFWCNDWLVSCNHACLTNINVKQMDEAFNQGNKPLKPQE